jgi:hypothetical protein
MNELIRKRARYLLADTLLEPVLFFDKKNLLADFNKEAAEKFGLNEKMLNILTRECFETSILQLKYEEDPNPKINREVVVDKDYASIIYHFTVQQIHSTVKGFIGRVYAFQDISKQKMMYNALEHMSAYDQLTGFYTSRVFYNKLEELNKIPEEYIVAICNIAGLKLFNAYYDRTISNGIIKKMNLLLLLWFRVDLLKLFGGSVKMGMSGKLLYAIEQKAMAAVAHIVPTRK